MKQIILKVFIIAFMVFWNLGLAFAWNIHHFKVIATPDKIWVWEGIDLTIQAVDKNENIVTDYEWTVLIFSESDREAQFPNALDDNSYTFQKSDEWVKKFENAVKFSNKWTNDIHVYDLDDQTDSLMWLAEVEVTEKVAAKKVDISILSPESWLTIWKKTVNVSWKTDKNHQVKIILNWKDDILTTSDGDWIFEKEVDWLSDWENIFKAYVLDWDDNVIWSSKEVKISINASLPSFNKLIIAPNWESELEPETLIKAEVYATKWLWHVSVILDDWINELIETTSGVYKWDFLVPKIPWEYNIDVLLKDELGNKIKELKKWVIIVKEITNSAVVEPEPELEPVVEPEKKIRDKCIDWDYSWDVFDWKCWTKPENYSAPIDLWIKNLRIVKMKTKTVLTWDKLSDASKYEVYKKIEWEDSELIDTVEEAKFEINITWDNVKYEYFAVKAIWKKIFKNWETGEEVNKEISWDLSEAIKIQTWAKEILLVLLALFIWFVILIFSKRRA